MDILQLVLRAVFSLVILFIITKLMGYRQISQLSFYDYIIGITIGSMAADMATDLQGDIWSTLIPMIVYGLFSIFISFLTVKSIKARRFMTGSPIVLIYNGEILHKNLKKVHYDMNDFLSECRSQGYFDVKDISYAIMEHTGKISILANPAKRPCCPEDLNLQPQGEGLVTNLIIDGKVLPRHLTRIGKEEKWLEKQLKEKNVRKEELILATYDINGNFEVYKKNDTSTAFDVLE